MKFLLSLPLLAVIALAPSAEAGDMTEDMLRDFDVTEAMEDNGFLSHDAIMEAMPVPGPGRRQLADVTPLIDQGAQDFYFIGPGPNQNFFHLPLGVYNPPFTFTGPVVVTVSDVLTPGDQFEVYDNGVSVGKTSAVSGVNGPISIRTYCFGPGEHSLEVVAIVAPNGAGLCTIEFSTVDSCDAGTLPDPHFKTFANKWFDFHGGCDLVLMNIPKFNFGAGLVVHIRTTVRYAYSYIESAAIQIGDEILQVSSFGEYELNGVSTANLPNTLSGYFVNQTFSDRKQHEFYIDLKDGRHFTIKVFKDMVSFSFHLPGSEAEFEGIGGLLGHHTGGQIARDGITMMEDPIEFGQEWQVRDTEPMLFSIIRAPQYPGKCVMPDPLERASRRLEATISEEAAAKACGHIDQEEIRDMCIFDVISTDDISVASSGVY